MPDTGALAGNRTRLMTVCDDDSNGIELYWARSDDDHSNEWNGSLGFHPDGSVSFKCRTTGDDTPIVMTIYMNRIVIAITDDVVGATEDRDWPLGEVLLDTATLEVRE